MLTETLHKNGTSLVRKLTSLMADDNIRTITIHLKTGEEIVRCSFTDDFRKEAFAPVPALIGAIVNESKGSSVTVEKRKETGTLILQPVLLALLHRSFARIKKFREKMQQGMQVEDVHQFRVEIKKLRAFLRMVSFNQQKELKVPRRLRNEYRKAGAIRDLQLTIEQTSRASISKKYRYELNKKKQQLITETSKKRIKRMMKKAGKKISQQLPPFLPVTAATGFIDDKLRSIHSVSRKQQLSDGEIHSIRKNLKDVLYDVINIGENAPALLLEMHWPKEKQGFYMHLTEDLGKYQDCTIELKKLEETDLSKDTEESRETLRLYDEQKDLRNQLRTSLEKQSADARI